MQVYYSVRSAPGRWILAGTVLVSSTTFLLSSAVSIALPNIQRSFNTGISGLQWVVDAQLIALASLIIIGGSLGDRFGRKRVLLIGMLLFVISAVLAATAGSILELIIVQISSGIASALMVPQSLAIINVSFTEKERGQAIGLWAGLSGGIGIMGPWLGGWLVEQFAWPSVFIMTIPILAAALVITYFFIPESKNPAINRTDWTGTILIFLSLLGIAYGLISGSGSWSSPVIIICLAGGIAAGAAFILIERRSSSPVLPFEIFRSRLVSGANLATLFLYFALSGVSFLCVLDLQQVQDFTPAAAGLALLPTSVLITLFSGPAGVLADRIGPRIQMVLGPALAAIGIGILFSAGTGASYFTTFFPGLLLLGAGMALVIAPLTKSALFVPPEKSGAASGINNAAARVAGMLAIAIVGIILTVSFSSRIHTLIPASTLPPQEQSQILSQTDKLAGITIPDSFSEQSRLAAKQIISDSFVYGFRRAVLISALLAFLAAVISAIMIRNPVKNGGT